MYACNSVRSVVARERDERAQQHELVQTRHAVAEERVVRNEPSGLRLGRELGRRGLLREVTGQRRRGDPRRDVRRLRHRPRSLALEEVLGRQLILGVQVGLDPEQVLGIAQVLAELRRHLADRCEQIGERALPRLQDRIVVFGRVERDGAVIGVDGRLHAVADVVRVTRDPGVGGQLDVADALGVREAAGADV